ncbi:sulfite reductase subunit beta [Ktedonobacter sp. SOSP1-52]|uniref:NADPH-dependent assimilatory sulfite reductase hemoprotein subunit n=1 Tax=Ktedonobacter sp. SOSP1-52 TaxID=2778366 RepID=UPI00191581F3|nr:NADPH-dependent assimilatory sulfite reductase hemoprotein subunit [Ktedonobacter sp. SOSP1-52]GHO66637.1 sulfite reductase subunit beta [Ktedonobacter sp. SOSP1-52]
MSIGHEDEIQANDLKHLGPGEGSKVEHIKLESQHLRGQLPEELASESSHFSEDQIQLIKFHGIYQQEDRDARQQRKAAHTEKAYQFMVRTRIPGGAITAEQYLAHDDISNQYANGTIRITTRQGLQLHGILKGDLKPAIASINEALLSTLAACGDVNRNVMACPAPTSSRAQAQVQEIAHKIAMHLAPRSQAYHEIWIDGEKIETPTTTSEEVEPIYGPTYLPRKFKIAVAFPGDNCVDIYTQDVGLIAILDGEDLAGFTLVIGGGMGMTHGKTETYPRLANPLCDIKPEEALKVIETIVTVQRDYGDRKNRKHARMKYVVEERGIAWFKQQVEERLGYTLREPSPVHLHDVEDHLGWHQQADGRWFLGLHVQNGRIRDIEQLQLKSGLRAVIGSYQPGVRLTGQQNILLTDIQAEDREALEDQLRSYGIETDPSKVGSYRFAMACPSLPTCGLALAEAERALPGVMQQLDIPLRELGLDGEPLSVRMTGCPNGCARPYMGDIGLVGRSKNLYNVYIGGDRPNARLNTLYATSIHTDKIVETLTPLLSLWKAERQPQESFGDFCHRIGVEQLRERVASVASPSLPR